MASEYGACFVVLQPFAEGGGVLYGRNSYAARNEVTEVLYFPASGDSAPRQVSKCASANSRRCVTLSLLLSQCASVEVEGAAALPVILSGPAGAAAADSGANERGVALGLCYAANEAPGGLAGVELVRLGLERGATAAQAVEAIGALVEKHGQEGKDAPRSAFVACDAGEAWLLSVVGNLWAAERLTEGFHACPRGLNVRTRIDKSCADLRDKAQSLGVWDGSGDFSFAAAFGCSAAAAAFPVNAPAAEASFTLTHMFQVLRADELQQDAVVSSHVSALAARGAPCHWFTATPNARESVFKPFVFTRAARISPLTVLDAGRSDQTLLFKYHRGRNWAAVGNLLASLEETCVAEVKDVLASAHDAENHELEDLMKDCVEAEVKFYR
ncbi:secernin-1 [Phlebotomus argentipes]|uniref:secernin-1 n=1 Tax=Phlebotomus argentipes TaxID=94469 RepID=UPI0028933ED3|nr:secernin-1 [Phlebotomus argentipes]